MILVITILFKSVYVYLLKKILVSSKFLHRLNYHFFFFFIYTTFSWQLYIYKSCFSAISYQWTLIINNTIVFTILFNSLFCYLKKFNWPWSFFSDCVYVCSYYNYNDVNLTKLFNFYQCCEKIIYFLSILHCKIFLSKYFMHFC